jgi:hypothetical protein
MISIRNAMTGLNRIKATTADPAAQLRPRPIERPRSHTDQGDTARASVNGLLTAAEPSPLRHPYWQANRLTNAGFAPTNPARIISAATLGSVRPPATAGRSRTMTA